MAKKITAVVKLQLPAGKATPAPPVGSTLGPHGINIPGFTKEFNAKTAAQAGLIIPCVVTIYQDRSFTFELKTPPTPVLIKTHIFNYAKFNTVRFLPRDFAESVDFDKLVLDNIVV